MIRKHLIKAAKKARRVKIRTYTHTGELEQAEQYIRFNSIENTYDFKSDFELSTSLTKRGLHQEASQILNRIVNLSEKFDDLRQYNALHTRALKQLADSEYLRFNFDAAEQYLDRILFYTNPVQYFSVNELYLRIYIYTEDYERAFKKYNEIFNVDYKAVSRHYDGYFNVASQLHSEVLPEQLLHELNGGHHEYYSCLALARYYASKSDTDKALFFLDKMGIMDTQYFSLKGEIEYNTGRYDQSRKSYLRAWLGSKGQKTYIGKAVLAYVSQSNGSMAKFLPKILVKLPSIKRENAVYRKIAMMGSNIPEVFETYRNTEGVAGLRNVLPKKMLDSLEADNLKDCSLLALPMWGIADELMIAGIYGDLSELLVKRNVDLTIGVEPRLLSLMQRSFPGIRFRAIDRKHRGPHVNKLTLDKAEKISMLPSDKLHYTLDATTWDCINQFDYILPIPFAVKYLRKTQSAFKGSGAYLLTDLELTQKMKSRLLDVSKKPKVGICWRSGFSMSNRSIYYTAIKQWGELLQHSDQVDFVNLQYDNCEAELSDAEKEFNLNITNFSDIDLFNDFESICALISSLDLVIAPCTVMSDLAGALGVKTLYLVNSPEGNWRFRHGTNQDIWFSDIEFIKPDAFGDTDSLMKNLASSFNDRLKEILK